MKKVTLSGKPDSSSRTITNTLTSPRNLNALMPTLHVPHCVNTGTHSVEGSGGTNTTNATGPTGPPGPIPNLLFNVETTDESGNVSSTGTISNGSTLRFISGGGIDAIEL
jgi:hypothetical protein